MLVGQQVLFRESLLILWCSLVALTEPIPARRTSPLWPKHQRAVSIPPHLSKLVFVLVHLAVVTVAKGDFGMQQSELHPFG